METQNLVKEICPTTTQEWIQKGALLGDVREKDEVAELSYDVPNILNIPLSEFEARYTEIPMDKDVVMVCRSGGRSLRAAGFLKNHGYSKVLNMHHGLLGWLVKGFPTKGNSTSTTRNTSSGSCCGPSPSSKCC
jgi:rhodanese-related sulfurtransferase